MADPYTEIDALVAGALTGFTDLTALVPVENIQFWDRDIDIRGQVEEDISLGPRIWIVPRRGDKNFTYSSGSMKVVRRYGIGFGTGTMKRETANEIDYQIDRAFLRLNEHKKADGITPILHPTPFTIESVEAAGTNAELEPLEDPQEWTDFVELTVVAFASRALLLQ